MQLQKTPVPPIKYPVGNIHVVAPKRFQLSAQQLFEAHVDGKAHKKKLTQKEKAKTKWRESEKCPVCNIHLFPNDVTPHFEGKAHKKKLIQQEKEKTKWRESEKAVKEEAVTPPKIPKTIPSKGINDKTNIKVASNNAPISSDNIVRNSGSSGAESILIQPSLTSNKKNNNKVNQFI